VQVLVVQPHKGELDAVELALGDIFLRRLQREFANLLEVSISRLAGPHARDLQQLRSQLALGVGAAGKGAEPAGRAQRRHGAEAGRALQEIAPA
jgi:hypothetical protein